MKSALMPRVRFLSSHAVLTVLVAVVAAVCAVASHPSAAGAQVPEVTPSEVTDASIVSVDPAPSAEPAPADPAVAAPVAVEAAPVEPAPVEPAPVEPAPAPDAPSTDPVPDLASPPPADAELTAAHDLAVGVVVPAPTGRGRGTPQSIAAIPGATIDQCNNTGSVGGDTITCTVTITNDFTYNAATPNQPTGLATIVTTVSCTGSAVCPSGGTTTSTTPVTTITQCNDSGLGGASTVTCTVTVTNNLTGYPIGASIDSTVLQCQSPGGVTTLTCVATPPGNNRAGTAGPGGQSVTQCNASGGAGGTLTCTVTAPPSQDTGLPTTITQCVGSGTTGASTVTCTATITNNFIASIPALPIPPPVTPPPVTPPPVTPPPATGTPAAPLDATLTPVTLIDVSTPVGTALPTEPGPGGNGNGNGNNPTAPPGGSTPVIPTEGPTDRPGETQTDESGPSGPGDHPSRGDETTTHSRHTDTSTSTYRGPRALPFTGLNPLVPALAGLLMLLLGIGLRRYPSRARGRLS